MRNVIIKAALAVVLLGGVVAAIPGASAQNADAAFKYRKAVMSALGGHMGSLGAIAKGEVSHGNHMVGHAAAINAIAGMTADLFPAGSGGDNTRAKDEIWSNAADFKAKVADFQNAAAMVFAAANSGDAAAVGKAMGALGGSCGGCHKPYRKDAK
jgi:cytochrome c556